MTERRGVVLLKRNLVGGGTSLEKNKTECYCYFYVYWRGFDVYSEGMCFSSTKHFYKYT